MHLLRLLPALLLTGCLQFDAVVKVKPDGSGTVEEKVMMGGAMVSQMKAMTQAFGGDKAGGAKSPDLYDEAKAKAQAAKMGEGVTFVSGKKLTTPDGSEGFTATYAFADINKLKLSTSPGDLAPGGAGGGMSFKGKGGEAPVVFQFTKGKTAELLVKPPQPKPDASTKAKKDAPSPEDAMQEAMLPMMQQMLKDMHMTVVIEVQGNIVETNAQWRDASRITLMDLDFNKVLADPAKLKALTKIKDPNSSDAKALLKTVPGVKVETAETVKIKFQ